MKKSTIQKEKIDNVGIHSFSKKSNFFFTLLLTLVGSPSELSMSMNACCSILEIATISKSSPNLTME